MKVKLIRRSLRSFSVMHEEFGYVGYITTSKSPEYVGWWKFNRKNYKFPVHSQWFRDGRILRRALGLPADTPLVVYERGLLQQHQEQREKLKQLQGSKQ